MTESELLHSVKRIKYKAKKHSEQLFTGAYHSAFKGSGMNFAEVRPYAYGDDWRHLDWNVTARTGTPHIKVFQEERELQVILVCDISPSAMSGGARMSKQEAIAEICATISYTAAMQNDLCGLVLFDEEPRKFRKPAKGISQCMHIIRDILQTPSFSKQTQLNEALRHTFNHFRSRSLCFIISDFETPDFQHELKILATRHEVIGIWVSDENEDQLPDLGLIPVTLAEQGQKIWLDSSSKTFRQQQAIIAAEKKRRLQQCFAQAGASIVHLPTVEQWMIPLLRFLASRKK